MDNKTKCIIGIIIVFIIIALIFFWPSAPSAKPTHMVCDSHEADENGTGGYIKITCYENGTNGERDVELENVTVLVNVTYTNKTVVKYNLTTDSNGVAKITDLGVGTYTVSAKMAGDNTHNTSVIKDKVKIKKDTTSKKTKTKTNTDTEYKTETEYDTEYETKYDTEYETHYDTEYETYTEPSESYTVEYYWVYV
jgi:hypothetical protein